jgi:hypothetical protein
MADLWEYTVSPKIWDTDEDFTHMLATAHEALDYEFVGAVEIQGWEHHVWRRPPANSIKAFAGWTSVLQAMAKRSGKKLGRRARRFLKSLAKIEQATVEVEPVVVEPKKEKKKKKRKKE